MSRFPVSSSNTAIAWAICFSSFCTARLTLVFLECTSWIAFACRCLFLLEDVGCIRRDLVLVRDAGGAVVAAITFDLVLRAGGCDGKFTCGDLSCRRPRRTAVRCCAARLARVGIGLGLFAGLLGVGAIGTLGTGVGTGSTLGACWIVSTLGTAGSWVASCICWLCNFVSTCWTMVFNSSRLWSDSLLILPSSVALQLARAFMSLSE